GASTGAGDVTTHHTSLGWDPSSGLGSAYCELYDNGTNTVTQFTWTFDDVTYSHAGTMIWSGTRLANGSGTFTLVFDSSTVSCSSTWPSTTFSSGSVARPALAAQSLYIYSENLLLSVNYFIDIRTN